MQSYFYFNNPHQQLSAESRKQAQTEQMESGEVIWSEMILFIYLHSTNITIILLFWSDGRAGSPRIHLHQLHSFLLSSFSRLFLLAVAAAIRPVSCRVACSPSTRSSSSTAFDPVPLPLTTSLASFLGGLLGWNVDGYRHSWLGFSGGRFRCESLFLSTSSYISWSGCTFVYCG